MDDFTRQEKAIICFLSFVLILGIGVNFYKRNRRQPQFGLNSLKLDASNPAPKTSPLIDINQSDTDQLSQLPGIGPELARRIVEYRATHGRFNQPQDLLGVKGIGKKKIAELENFLDF